MQHLIVKCSNSRKLKATQVQHENSASLSSATSNGETLNNVRRKKCNME